MKPNSIRVLIASLTAYWWPIAGTRVSLFGPVVSVVDTDTQGCETALGAVMSAPGGLNRGPEVTSRACPSIIGVSAMSQGRLGMIFA